MNTEIKVHSENSSQENRSPSFCGIVMPIAAMGDYSESHWLDIQNIIKEAVSLAGYEARLVSESVEATVIIRSIVQNVYSDEIVVCDVSGMNPNVMFELGMRLAFDKPVVIIKDDATRFSFDISTIEHLEYPKSLRYQSIQNFKIKLSEKIKGTLKASKDEGYRSFLSNFGSFTVANLKDTTLNESEALETILNKLDKFDTRLLDVERRKTTKELLSNRSRYGEDYDSTVFEVWSAKYLDLDKYEKFIAELDNTYGNFIELQSQHDGKGLKSFKIISHLPKSQSDDISDNISKLWNKVYKNKEE